MIAPSNAVFRFDVALSRWENVTNSTTTVKRGTLGIGSTTNIFKQRLAMQSAYAAATRRFFLFGGVNSLGDIWQFDVATRRWTALEDRSAPFNVVQYGINATSLLPGRSGGFMFVSNEITSELMVVGGSASDGVYQGQMMDIWRYQRTCPRSITLNGESLCIPCNKTLVVDCQATSLSCVAGYQPDANGYFCEACPSGTYKTISGSGQCLSCPEGSICNSTSVVGCQNAYEWNNNLPCTPCVDGFYQPFTGVKMCMACVPGSSCNGASTVCPAGYTFNATARACVSCIETKTYKLSLGNYGCTNCPANSLCGTTNFFCLPGNFWNGTACISCDGTKYKPIAGNDTSCSTCPVNAICDGTNYQCDAGFNLVGTQCIKCDNDRYKSTAGNQTCTLCPTGAVCTQVNYRCDLGFTLNATTLQCDGCPIDQFKDTTGNDTCTFCKPPKIRLADKCYCEYGTNSNTGQCNTPPIVFDAPTIATVATSTSQVDALLVLAPTTTESSLDIAGSTAFLVESTMTITDGIVSSRAVDTSKITTSTLQTKADMKTTTASRIGLTSVIRSTPIVKTSSSAKEVPLSVMDSASVASANLNVDTPTTSSEPKQPNDVDLSNILSNPVMISGIAIVAVLLLILGAIIIRCVVRKKSKIQMAATGIAAPRSFDVLTSPSTNDLQSFQTTLSGSFVNPTMMSNNADSTGFSPST